MRDGIDRPQARGSTVVMHVDMHYRFFRNLSHTIQEMLMVSHVRLIEECAEHDVPFVIMQLKGAGVILPELSREIESVPRKLILTKPRQDAFDETCLEKDLKRLNPHTLLFAGVFSSQCVLATAKSARRLGYGVATSEVMIADCPCSSCSETAHREAITWFAKNGTCCPDYVSPLSLPAA